MLLEAKWRLPISAAGRTHPASPRWRYSPKAVAYCDAGFKGFEQRKKKHFWQREWEWKVDKEHRNYCRDEFAAATLTDTGRHSNVIRIITQNKAL